MNFKNMTIKTKLIGSLILAVVVPMIILAIISIDKSGAALEQSAINQLSAIRAIKHSQISSYLNERKGDVEVYAANSAIQMAMDRFNSAYKQNGLNGDTYKKWENLHGPKLKVYMDTYGYYDIFFINPEGDVIYTVAKEGDLGQNVKTGPLAKSGLGKAYKKGLQKTSLIDFEWYDISNEPASFVSTPIINPDGRLEGVLVYQIPLKAINVIMQQREGMGETGETYLVGQDKRMRSDSFLDPTGHSVGASFAGTVQANGVDTKAVREALAGKTGNEIIKDYNGNDVFSSYQPLDLGDFKWVIIAEIDKAEVEKPVIQLRNSILILSLVIGVIFIALAIFLATSIQKGISQVIAQISGLVKDVVNGRLDSRANPLAVVIDFQELLKGLNELINAFVAPINVTAEYVDRISKGDIPEKITDEYKGDFNEIKNNLNMCIDAVNGLVAEAKMLTKAAVEGTLDVRGDASKFNGDYKGIVQGVNDTLDAVIGPLNVTAEYVDRISKGDIPERITDNYNGDFNEIKNNLNSAIDVMNGLLEETDKLIVATKNGQLDTRGEASRFKGGWGDLVSGVNDLINAFVGPINVTAEYVDRISKGDIPEKITDEYKGDFNEIKNNLNSAIDVMNGLLKETDKLIVATKNGQLDTRGEASRFSGGWGDLVSGINDLINAFVGPINVTAEYVDRISKGDIPEKITDEYKGDFNEIKSNLNMCIDALNGLINDMNHMSEQHDLGDIDIKIDADKFQGAYKEMGAGVNKMVFGHIGVKKKAMACIAEFGKGNFNAELEKFPGKKAFINDTIEAVRKNLKEVSNEIKTLIKAAGNGELDKRGIEGNLEGDWSEMITGINSLIEAIVLPMQEAASVMAKIADKDITARVTGNYKGQLDEFKNDINVAATNLDDALQNIANSVEQVSSASEQVAKGSQQLAEGSNEQASSIEEVSASLEEMSSMTQQNSDNSNQAKTLAETSHKEAVAGKANMDRMSDAILKIKESSDETSKIVKTIDEIAFQTNLLALNAAVEAARAGEAGKGFAVVAEEVRNLAQRSAEAAKNTSQLIEESVENADNGVKITTEAAKGLESIVDSVKKTNDLINEIAAASKEQAIGIDQVSTAVQEMNKVTQENASNSEESASAAEEMSSQAVSMTAMIAEFALSNKNHTMSSRKVALAPKREVIKQKPQKRSQVVKPDEVIPLDDDDFDDF